MTRRNWVRVRGFKIKAEIHKFWAHGVRESEILLRSSVQNHRDGGFHPPRVMMHEPADILCQEIMDRMHLANVRSGSNSFATRRQTGMNPMHRALNLIGSTHLSSDAAQQAIPS
jgi:hypothetical protein